MPEALPALQKEIEVNGVRLVNATEDNRTTTTHNTLCSALERLIKSGSIQCLALVCILFTAVVWGFALFFFFQGLSTWQVCIHFIKPHHFCLCGSVTMSLFITLTQKTPAESRDHNRECILLSFFDDHDIWHFLSSIAMFGSFLV